MNLRPVALTLSVLGLAGALTSSTAPASPTAPAALAAPTSPTSPVPAAAPSGLGAPDAVTTATAQPRSWGRRRRPPAPDRQDLWKAVPLHELGHVMGLDHAGTSRRLMYPVLLANLTDLQAGDLTGLSRLGRSAGCVVMPRLG